MTKKEFEKFDSVMKKLISVPHSEIKAQLDAEKQEKRTPKRITKKGKKLT